MQTLYPVCTALLLYPYTHAEWVLSFWERIRTLIPTWQKGRANFRYCYCEQPSFPPNFALLLARICQYAFPPFFKKNFFIAFFIYEYGEKRVDS